MRSASDAALVEVEGLEVRLNGASLIRDITMNSDSGEVVGVVGPNGAGKSTFVKALAGLIPSRGSARVDGLDPARSRARALARRIALVPQSASIEFDFPVREVVMMGRTPHVGRLSIETENDRAIVAGALERVGAAHLSERGITSLSGGERQLVLLAKALAQQPRLLLLDEPTSALDLGHQIRVLSLTRELARSNDIGVIAVLHDLNLAARFTDRIVLFHRGRVLADGSPSAVFTPDYLAEAYGIDARVRFDPEVNAPAITVLAAHDTDEFRVSPSPQKKR